MGLSTQRRFVTPEPGEKWPEIAARILPDQPAAEAIQTLKSWNLHLFVRMPPGEFLGSDVLFVEPPLAGESSMFGAVDQDALIEATKN